MTGKIKIALNILIGMKRKNKVPVRGEYFYTFDDISQTKALMNLAVFKTFETVPFKN